MSDALRSGEWIAVDWGTTSMRARRVGVDGSVVAEAAAGPGMGALEAHAFEPALLEAVAPWLGEVPAEVLVCGMAGARQGWIEAPYVELPAALTGLLDHAVRPETRDPRLDVRIVPGLCRRDPADVMRGEETQLLGLLAGEDMADATVCLPGTHSKWARIEGRRVTGFETHMTGELYALLSSRSVLRHSVDEGADEGAFDAAVGEALDDPVILPRLFGLRASSLLEDVGPGTAAARLSGWLIGAEIARAPSGPDAVHVVASGALASRYARALAVAEREARVHDGGTLAVAGLAALRARR